jgi:hypothetical protein
VAVVRQRKESRYLQLEGGYAEAIGTFAQIGEGGLGLLAFGSGEGSVLGQ